MLELRIHGVNNTPPAALLDLPPGGVEQTIGDNLGSFWRPTAASQRRLRPGDRGYVPPGVLREAYSWGGMARSTPGPSTGTGTGTWTIVLGVLGRIGWTLLLPFGLVNVAFWSRRLEPGNADRGWQDDATAAGVRLFALCLTLLSVVSASFVSLDLVATQCFAGGTPENPQAWCPALPAFLDALATWDHGNRLAALTVVPIAVLALVMGLSAATRVRYEHYSYLPPPTSRNTDDDVPLLATPGFWSNASLTSAVGRLHVVGGIALVVVITAGHQVLGAGPGCTDHQGVLGGECLAQLQATVSGPDWWFVASSVAALVLLGVVGVELGKPSSVPAANANPKLLDRAEASDTTTTARLARDVSAESWAAGILLAVHLVTLVVVTTETDPTVPLVGGTLVSALLVGVMLVIALLGLRWRARGWQVLGRSEAVKRAARPFEAWGGRAPAVFLLLSLGTAMTLSSFVVVGVGNWLNQGKQAGALLRGDPVPLPAAGAPALDCTEDCAAPDLSIPPVYIWFGAAIVIALLVLLVGALWGYFRTSKTLDAAGDRDAELIAGRPGLLRALRLRRRWAGTAHRALPIVGLLATAVGVTTGLSLTWTLAVAQWPQWAPRQLRGGDAAGSPLPLDPTIADWYATGVDRVAWAVGAGAIALLATLVGGALVGGHRPLGLVWDLICFLPRAGHPFGPPCYAERAVPELLYRYEAEQGDDCARHIVVSAHSLGAVLAVASIFAVWAENGRAGLERFALLTHGTQLRPYFGRMFPELLGPAALGTHPCLRPALSTPDPWHDVVEEDRKTPPCDRSAAVEQAGPPDAAAAGTDLASLLTGATGPRWVGLWRRTDPLGFPVDRYAGSCLDRAADEIDRSGYLPVIGTHSGYTRTRAYDEAVTDLRTWLDGSGAAPGP